MRINRAFTLVELLVVIGIIAILIGLLIPVITRAREQGNRAACASNLRQIVIGIQQYSEAHKGLLPNGNDVGGDGSDDLGLVLVTLATDYVKNASIFRCAGDIQPPPELIYSSDYDMPDSARMSYEFFSLWWDNSDPLKMVRVKQASLIWDLDGGSVRSLGTQNHGVKGGNVAFSDGRVEWTASGTKQWAGDNWPIAANAVRPRY
jgi:prepilin-type N-terminal cleavage/methylation domain-containing protein